MDLATKSFFLDLWKLQIPVKLKISMWKVYNNFMPTFDNLTKRHIGSSIFFQLCQTEAESIDHLLRKCPATCQIWKSLHLPMPIMLHYHDHKTWLVDCFQADDRYKKLMTITVWAIWYAKNKLIHDGQRKSMQDVTVYYGLPCRIKRLESCNPLEYQGRSTPLEATMQGFY